MGARELLSADGPLPRVLPNYRPRPLQETMAHAVERALAEQGVLLVEAGTGTGKTLAYLLPAILSGSRVVISTGTLALQDQIMEHDIPLIERALGHPVEAACLKGLANYLCLRRYEDFRRSADSVGSVAARDLPMLDAWRETTVSGDRAELEGLPEDAAIWANVRSSPETRIGSECVHYEACFATRARRRAEGAQIVVVNHHLYFADLATRGPYGGGFLPEHDAVIFDEAHQIEDTMTGFFGVTVSSARIEELARDAERVFGRLGHGKDGQERVRETLVAAEGFFQGIPARSAQDGARAPLDRAVLSGSTELAMFRLDAALEALGAFAKLRGAADEAATQLVRRAQALRDDLATVAAGETRSHVVWMERRAKRVAIGASPVDVAPLFRDEVLHRRNAVVLTSATLATSGSFEFVRSRLGIEAGATELVLDSPFDFAEQAGLYVPPEVPDPRDGRFFEAAGLETECLVRASQGGAFVLCTSIRSMDVLAAHLQKSLPYVVMKQGDGPKASLLARFKSDGNAVLVATQSFWEGIDVPGRALRLVVIDKLPFDVPTDPLVAARCRRIEEEGEQPFIRHLVPAAALALKQGFGRLIRREGDRGVVAVLDTRLVTKGYGKVLLRSLPPARRLASIDEVRSFFEAGP